MLMTYGVSGPLGDYGYESYNWGGDAAGSAGSSIGAGASSIIPQGSVPIPAGGNCAYVACSDRSQAGCPQCSAAEWGSTGGYSSGSGAVRPSTSGAPNTGPSLFQSIIGGLLAPTPAPAVMAPGTPCPTCPGGVYPAIQLQPGQPGYVAPMTNPLMPIVPVTPPMDPTLKMLLWAGGIGAGILLLLKMTAPTKA